MEEQVPPSQQTTQLPIQPQITSEQLEEMKFRARQLAIQQTLAQNVKNYATDKQIVYVRRNLTVAEIILVVLLACGIVTGIQFSWSFVRNVLPRVEIQIK
tara:strand:- start:1217 stop:1516 length:300 start_codon:yes stop_codon:yes gene_type:complete